MFSLYTFLKSSKKRDYIVNTGRSKLLDSFYFENQAWGALHKCWKGYVIAKNKDEHEKMEIYGRRIPEWQHALGLPIDSFDDIGMSADDFLSEIAGEEDNNNYSNQVEQKVSDEQYSDDYQYQQDKLTDDNAYSEYFRDDFNAGDGFTS
jgi:hypothetical protein